MIRAIFLSVALFFCALTANAQEYVVLASDRVMNDGQWTAVAEKLAQRHEAPIRKFDAHPREALPELQKLRPRWVAIVEMPEQLNRDYIMELNRMSREVDDDIYADYLWGVISGYDAASAMRMVENSTEPLVIKNAVATIMETNSAKWFDRYGYVDDHTAGLWGHKDGPRQPVVTGMVDTTQVLRKFTELYAEYDPDLILTAAHATEKNLEMPFSLGNWKAHNGVLYAEDKYTGEKWDVPQNGKRKVYFAMGNCLIGNFNNTRESMAPAWINSADAATMAGYVVTTWHGRNGWGGLKYWLTYAGNLTLAQAIYLNQQDMLHQLNEWSPELVTAKFPYQSDFRKQHADGAQGVAKATGAKATLDQVGFWHDRDVLAYYGDPKWDMKLQEPREYYEWTDSLGYINFETHFIDYFGSPLEKEFSIEQQTSHYDVTMLREREGNKVEMHIQTYENFDLRRLQGDGFKQEHVLDLPFANFFSDRLPGARMVSIKESGVELDWDTVLTEDFILIYNPAFEPGKTYKIELEYDGDTEL